MINNTLDVYIETAVYTVTPVQYQAVYDLLWETAKRWQRALPGLLSVNVYPSENHTRVLYQVEWRTREDWHNTLQHPEREAVHSKVQAIDAAIEVDVQIYQVPQVIKGPVAEHGLIIPRWKDEDATPVTIVAPEERKSVILSGEQTNNAISIIGFTNTPGEFNALHYHTREDEIWYIIDGEWEFEINGKVQRGGPGDTVFGPRYIPHCFRNAGDSVGHLIIIYTPAGNERFFLQLDEWAEKGIDISYDMIKNLADSMGNYLVPRES